MSSLKWSLAAFVVSALITAGAFNLSIQRTAREGTTLRASNQKLRADILARSDARAAKPPPTAQPAAPQPSAPAPAREGAPAALSSYYRNEGQATPVATLQTFAWACDNGDVEMVAKLLTFDGNSRAKVEAFMATLPEALQGQWSSPEILAATVCISGYMRRPYPAALIIDLAETEPIGTDHMKLKLPGTPLDGGIYQKTDQGWKFVIPEADIDDYIAKNFGKEANAAK